MSRSTRKASDTATPPPAPTVGVPDFLDVDGLIADQRIRIVVVCGAGGVGKTTSAAALALRAAEAGRKVVVLTIDPARRLAQSLGVAELDNTPRPVRGLEDEAWEKLSAEGVPKRGDRVDMAVARMRGAGFGEARYEP